MSQPTSFPQFALLPCEIRRLILKFAFAISLAQYHTPILITSAASLQKALKLKHNYLGRPVPCEDCKSSTWTRPAPMPKNWLIHDKNIYSSHGNGEWRIYLRSNASVEGECWSIKHVRVEAGGSVCLGGNGVVCADEEGSGGWRIVLSKKEGLIGLLQACRLSRLVVLEEWMKLLEGKRRTSMRGVETEHLGMVECAQDGTNWGGECDDREVEKEKEEDSRLEMVTGVVRKILDELRIGAGV